MELNSIADALSGLQANQTYMDVVGNNISNVNTTGYKTQNIHFEDLMNQTLSYGTQAGTNSNTTSGLEGSNPFQVGMGVGQGSINLNTTQGSVQDTGRLTDMTIQGNGYFVVNKGQQSYYTRDGSFTVSPDGILSMGANGMTVQGWPSKADGTVDKTQPLGDIRIPVGAQSASPTSKMALNGNLDASQATGAQIVTPLSVFDSQGTQHSLTATFTKSATTNTWSYTITDPSGKAQITSGGSGTLSFDANGKYQTAGSTTPPLAISGYGAGSGASGNTVALDFAQIGQLAQTGGVNVSTTDGAPGGAIASFSVGKDGGITAVYSNGTSKTVGQIALADFRNADGLIREGSNLYSTGVNSGPPQVGDANSANLGSILTGQLEGSNVDLAAQFGQMIQAQQGFNANTKVITTTNSMLQSVLSIVP